MLQASECDLKVEIAIIGSGPGGAITACLLAEAGRDVLLIEEGDDLPLESCQPFSVEEMVQKYRNGGLTAAFGQPKIQYVEGRCVGGGSEINSGLYHRTPLNILEQWRTEFEVDALTEADLIPHFEACEQAVNVCYLPGKAPTASLKLHEGAMRLGWQSLEVPRWFRYEESDETSVPKGTRQSMTKTFIPRALKAGCKLLANTRIKTLKETDKTWILTGTRQGNNIPENPIKIQAETVFVCCGAIQTPALLRRSGIKNNIGNSLKMHPTVKIIAQFDQEINALDMGVPVHQVKEFFPRFSFGCSISSPPYLSVGMTDHPQYTETVKKHWQNMAIYYAMITGESFGTVRNIPFYNDPLVRYKLTSQDLKDLSEALQKLALLLFEADAKILYPSISNTSPLTHPQDLTTIAEQLPIKQTNLMTVHVFSSCPMGENLQKCAVNSFGKVHGFNNLYIADASLLCTAPGVNPQGSIMAIARRNALKFLNKI
ncbi:putative GMC-type oxidoreductase y4nJ [Planktothrix tepida]|uniref:GMC-type oxidoreductase y4nJ n=2 Tax=Planktothrix TaxID=54304 RepID=A0A9W4CM40_9CYAN|nr:MULTISPECIES: GMC family oxidoreductase [Planktothrix]CAD5954082.1 putative GMC-type oxidoreductase y4nJ [Planktothrix tepida]CAD5956539.1 putative GMC-type oxidoreductase y4nJ [Planktothrix pseudagardhii]CUR34256.1 putative oxidoreductase [Planktothrix tepida PCC 9214]